jgi:hypothetical protein
MLWAPSASHEFQMVNHALGIKHLDKEYQTADRCAHWRLLRRIDNAGVMRACGVAAKKINVELDTDFTDERRFSFMANSFWLYGSESSLQPDPPKGSTPLAVNASRGHK